jgi:hypothetical protein
MAEWIARIERHRNKVRSGKWRGRDRRRRQKGFRRMFSVAAFLPGTGCIGRGRRGTMATGIVGRSYFRRAQRGEADGARSLQQKRRHRHQRGNSSAESTYRPKAHLQLPTPSLQSHFTASLCHWPLLRAGAGGGFYPEFIKAMIRGTYNTGARRRLPCLLEKCLREKRLPEKRLPKDRPFASSSS